MKLRICSDLHLEASPEYRLPLVEAESECVLVLAGDVCEFQRKQVYLNFMEDVCSRFRYVIHVPGNHEYYRGHVYESLKKAREWCNHLGNLYILNNEILEIDNVKFLCSTLWTDIDKGNPISSYFVQQGMNDYHLIRIAAYRKLKALDTMAIHKESREFLEQHLQNVKDKCVVISHHAPSMLSISDKYAGDRLNGGYASDLSDMILDNSPCLWIHGHMHDSFDYSLGKTRVVCNPKGYPLSMMMKRQGYSGYENQNFDDSLVIEI